MPPPVALIVSWNVPIGVVLVVLTVITHEPAGGTVTVHEVAVAPEGKPLETLTSTAPEKLFTGVTVAV